MMTREQAKQKLTELEAIKENGDSHHNNDWWDTPFYAELLTQMQECRDVMMIPEPSKDKEWETKW